MRKNKGHNTSYLLLVWVEGIRLIFAIRGMNSSAYCATLHPPPRLYESAILDMNHAIRTSTYIMAFPFTPADIFAMGPKSKDLWEFLCSVTASGDTVSVRQIVMAGALWFVAVIFTKEPMGADASFLRYEWLGVRAWLGGDEDADFWIRLVFRDTYAITSIDPALTLALRSDKEPLISIMIVGAPMHMNYSLPDYEAARLFPNWGIVANSCPEDEVESIIDSLSDEALVATLLS